jgi:hypothetical protein
MDEVIERAMEKLPAIREWIRNTLGQHAADARPVAAFGFKRLPLYFAREFLASIRAVVVKKVPAIPLASMGLPEFAKFEVMPAAAITYNDTYFVSEPSRDDESLHFHELVHVVQWAQLGIDEFLIAYGLGLLRHGYEGNPLEVQACEHQDRFERGEGPYDTRAAVCAQLPAIVQSLTAGMSTAGNDRGAPGPQDAE